MDSGLNVEDWLEHGGLRDPFTEGLLGMYRQMVAAYGHGGFDIKVEAGSLYMLPPEPPDES